MAAAVSANISLFGDFRVDRRAGVLFRRDQHGVFVPLGLGRRAVDILAVLVEHPGNLILRDDIMNAVWPGTVVEDGNLSVQISALRRVLDNGRVNGSLIQTVPGRGYRFVGLVTQEHPDPPPLSLPSPNADVAADMRIESSPAFHSRPATKKGAISGAPNNWHRWVGMAVLTVAVPVLWVSSYPWFPTPAVPRFSIVVRPLANLSDDREQQYFADGITDDLTTDLSALPGMLVISRNTAFTYQGKTVDAKQIGRELAVRYVLEGSVRRSGKQVRVNVQLIEAENNAHLWAERFDRDTGDLFALQNEITGRVANSLHLMLIRSEASRPTDRPDALDYFFRARAAASKPASSENYAEAISLYEQALALEPRSAPVQSRLAIQLTARVLDQMTDTRNADLARSEELIGQATVSSPDDPATHFAKGQLRRTQRRCAEAIPEYEATLAYNRNSVDAMSQIAKCKMFLGFVGEAIPLLEQALRLSPRDTNVWMFYLRLGQAYLLLSRVDEAIIWLEKSRRAHPANRFVHAALAAAYGLKGESNRATAELSDAQTHGGAGSLSSIARLRADTFYETPAALALYEATFLAGLRNAGLPEQ